MKNDDRDNLFDPVPLRWTIILTAISLIALFLVHYYSIRPVILYQVTAAPSSAPSVPVEENPPAVGNEVPVAEEESGEQGGDEVPWSGEDTESGPQEVLMEKSVALNTASLSELDRLPGVGPELAQRIVDYRSEHGGFTALEELTQVDGIGEKIFEKLEPYVYID